MKRQTLVFVCCALIALLCGPGKVIAQTPLAKGDISIIQFCSGCATKSYSFVTWVPLTNNTVIKFSNNAFKAATSSTGASNARGTQQGNIWTNTTGSTIAAGTVITVSGSSSSTVSTGTLTALASGSGGTNLNINQSTSGGKLFVYQGSDYSASADPTTFNGSILFGMCYSGSGSGISSFSSAVTASSFISFLPSDLNTSGYYIDGFGATVDGGQYTGSRSSQSSLAAYQALVANPANWTKGTLASMTIDATSFTVSTPNYYYKGTGAITTLSNWGTNSDGTGTAPGSFTNAGSTYFVANTSGTVNLSANWTVGSTTGTLNIASGIVLGMNGNTLAISGAIAGTGTLAGSSTSNLTLTGTVGTLNFTTGAANRTIKNLTLSASTTATLGTAITITGGSTPGTVTVGSSSTLTTGGNLTLSSDANGTGMIGNSAGSISGNVTIERYIPGGKRAFRFLAHPFSASIALTQLTDDIDITGTGGAANGFTATGSNSPSAFWYDITTGNGSSVSDPGWTAFTNTNGSGANSWDQYEAIRVLVRGSLGEGLTGNVYTPSAVTLDATGAVNQGSKVVTITKGAGTDYMFIGNPYPSEINLNLSTRGANIGSSFYVWNPSSGTRGAYVTNLFSSTYYLPSFSGFFVQAAANVSNTITFHEADKSNNGASGTVFKPTASVNSVLFKIYSNNDSVTWDQFQLDFDNAAIADSEWYDAPKLYNPDLSVYSFSKDQKILAIDTRPYADSQVIPLGIAWAKELSYKLKMEAFNMPAGTSLYLHDKYLDTTILLSATTEYLFDITSDSLTQGDNRFELATSGKPFNGISTLPESKQKVKLVPNPATNNVTVYYEHFESGNINITVTNILGVKVASVSAVSNQNGSIQIPLDNLAGGVYTVTVQNDKQVSVHNLIKQ